MNLPEEDLKRALEHDEAMRAVDRNKAEAVASGHAVPVTPEMDARVRRAQQLRIELGGFASLAPDIRSNPNVRSAVWPKVTEYVTLRLRLAADATFQAVQAELGASSAELRSMMQEVMTKGLSEGLTAGLPLVEATKIPSRADLLEALRDCTAAVQALTEAFSKTFADAKH